MNIKAIIFDLDGTILDTIEDLADAANEMLINNDFKTNTLQEYISWVGDGVEDLIRRALPKKNFSDIEISNYVEEFKNNYSKLCLNKTKPYAGIPELLSKLKERKIKTVVFSNKAHQFTIMITNYFFKEGLFDEIIGERKGYPRKPDPYVAIEIMKSLKVKPDETLFIGDSGNDMKTAIAAGITPVGVLWGYRNKAELIDSGAKFIIEKPDEILGLL
jgi:phosphoglycolate phosphatase